MTEASDPETGFLEQLGQRVRTMRALRGMSRKVLAKVSGISERYIAQLESGKGNVSIVLLRRVSNAMGAHLEDLIPATEPAPDWAVIRDLLRKATPAQIAQAKDALAGGGPSAQRRITFAGIALIGLRGAGKSTLGRMLAKKIGWSFVELNKEVERENGLSVAEIIALYGQEGFRRMEQAALGQLLARKELMVLATGGGIVSEPLTFDLILSSFYTIWLKAEPGVQDALVRADPERYFVPPYVGPSGWVGARLDKKPDWKAIAALVRGAWALSAPKKLLPAPARPTRRPARRTSQGFPSMRPRRGSAMRWRRCCTTSTHSACAARSPEYFGGTVAHNPEARAQRRGAPDGCGRGPAPPLTTVQASCECLQQHSLKVCY